MWPICSSVSFTDKTESETMEKLTSAQFKDFQNALCAAFTDAELAQMVLFGLDEKLSDLVQDAPLPHMAFELIQWTERHGRLRELIDGAAKANPGNPALKAFVAGLGIAAAGEVQAHPSSVPAPTQTKQFCASGNHRHPTKPPSLMALPSSQSTSLAAAETCVGSLDASLITASRRPSLVSRTLARVRCCTICSSRRSMVLMPSSSAFSYLDAHALAGVDQIGEFWRRALTPLGQLPAHQAQLQICGAGGYSEAALDQLVHHLAASGQRLVLLIDEFDALLHHSVLNRRPLSLAACGRRRRLVAGHWRWSSPRACR